MTRILVVDDDEPLRMSIARDLRRQGYEVAVAGGVEEALAALAAQPVDVLLTDLRMSGADGIDLLKAARVLSRNMRALLMSGFGTARDYQTAVDLGAVRVLCKPFTSAELSQAIRQAVECADGFRGSVHGLALVDVLQMFHLARRSVALAIDAGDACAGTVYLRDGALVHAELGERVGEDALRELLALRSGALRTSIVPDDGPRTITREFQSVVLDALRVMDEQSAERDWDLDEWELEAGEPAAAAPAAAAVAAPAVAPPAHAESSVALLESAWLRAWQHIAPTPLDLFAVGVDLRSGATVPLRGEVHAPVEAPVVALLDALARLSNDSGHGVLDCSGPSSAVYLIWDRRREVAVVAGDMVRTAGEAAMLRTAAWTLARHLLEAEARPNNSGGTHGQDR